jgi:ABC transporter DrrB family efflux protein
MHQPFQVIVNLLFPVMFVLLFGFLFGGSMTVPGGGDYREFLLPGMFAMTMVFGFEATFLAITTDINRGVTDRFRSMPMAASAILLGRSIADLLNSVLSLIVLCVVGLLVGWRWHGSFGEALLAMGLLLLLRFSLLWVGIYLGLVIRNTEAVSLVQILIWPISFLSNIFAAAETMPGWLGALVEWNPLSSTVTAIRVLFHNPGADGASWVAHHSLWMALLWPLLLLVIFFPLSVRRYWRLSR